MSVRITGDISDFNKNIANLQKQLNASTKGLQTIARNMTTVGDSMVKGITLPIIAIGAGLLKLGKDFDDAYDRIRVDTGATGKALDGLKDDFRAIAKVAPSSFKDISTAVAYFNTTLGLTDKPLQNLSVQVLNLSRITKTDLNTNVQNAAKLFNNWKIATEDQSKTLDFLFRASQQTGISIDKLMSEVTSTGPILRGMGFDIETTTALVAGFSKEGIDMGAVTMGMKKALVTMAKEGMSDPQEVLAMYIEKIKGAKDNIEATGIAAELFGARGGAAMAMAIREGRLNLDDLIESLKTGTDTINDASAATMDWKEKLILLRNNIGVALEPLAMKVFDALGKGIDKVTPKIEALAKWFGNLSPIMQDNFIKWGLIAAIIPVVISGVGRATTGFIKFRNAILLLNTAMLTSPAVLISAAIAQLGIQAVTYTDAIKKAKEGTQSWTEILYNLIPVFGPTIYAIRRATEGTKESTEAIEEQIPAIDKAKQSVDEYKQSLLDQGYTEEKATEIANEHAETMGYVADAEGNLEEATDDTTESIDDQTESIEDLRSEFNKFIEDLFEGITTYNDFQESNWALEDAQKALTEAIKKYGEGSREVEQAQNDLDDAMIANIETAFKLSNEIGVTTDQQEEARLKAIELGLQYVKTGAISMQSFIDMAAQFGISADDISRIAVIMGSDLDEATKQREIKIILDTNPVSKAVAAVVEMLNSIKDKKVTITTHYDTTVTTHNLLGSGLKGGALGGIFTGKEFLRPMVSAMEGMMIPKFDTGGVLALLHPPEIVLNAKEAMQLVWNMANRPIDTKQGAGSGIIMNNTFNSPKPLTESEINRNFDIAARELGYRIGMN